MLRKISFIFMFILFLGCSSNNEPQSFSFIALNTTCNVTIFSDIKVDEAYVKAIVENIESSMSSHLEGSDIFRINSGEVVKPDDSTLSVINRGLYFSTISNGLFDITIGPLVELWNVGERKILPEPDEVSKLLPLVDYKNIKIENNDSVSLIVKGMSLDLGAIAKGYAADVVKEYLVSIGVESAIINLGGNINLIGSKIDSSNWKIGIQHPRKNRGEYIGIVELSDTSLVSSGDYERYFEIDGERYHHILDSKTGYPLNGEFIASSIIYDKSMDSDALSTITFGSSLEEIKRLRSIILFSGIFITEDFKIYITEDLEDNFTLIDDRYRLIVL